ncbi:metal ABC transporter solute-binding protein, Zn/Mn family [Alteribacillus bidgolensis]|uniref:Zinc transport system substrate-binding protein n=1 Tax=Alteribacillus bidgolensis TaxID=930129 RepID=A0A1G8BSY1_9BACI|nr:zinc ABC transporter substrate-binding protein [Alteribacillus bidgolensis]SDH36218.1 zinc transport system substrate-binding protein [Alteribacillus bidgolensis]
MKNQGIFLLLLGASISIAACGTEEQNQDNTDNTEENESEPLQIYTTLYPWEEFTEIIGGDAVQVENLVPAGSDVHSFEPTAQTMVKIAESDAFIYNGAGMEGFADAVKDTAQQEGAATIEVTEELDLNTYDAHSHEETGEEDGHGSGEHEEEEHDHGNENHGKEKNHEEEHDHNHDHGDQDPHVWLDPLLAGEAAEKIKNELIELRPENEEEFEENFNNLKTKLNSIHDQFEEMAANTKNNTFLVSHAGYGYWEEKYGLHQIGISGLSPTNEPSQKQLQNIVQLAEENGINHVMFEQNVSSKVAQLVQKEVGAEALYLHNLESLTEEDIANDENYFTLMNKNIENLNEALNY